MIKEELIKNQFPNDEFLQSAVSLIVDKCVADLEQKLEQTEKDLADYQFNYPTINELEETNNELKGKLLLSDMVLADKTKRIKELEDKLTEKVTLESLDVVSAKMEELAKVNAELKLKLEALEGQTPWKDIKDKSELIKENTELKEQNIKDCENFNKTMKETKEQWNKEHYQLIKAKELIKTLSDMVSKSDSEDYFRRDMIKAVEEAEQFLNDVEK